MIVIKSGRHPLVVILMAAMVLSGVANTLNYDRAASQALRVLPVQYGYVYYGGLAVGAAITLAGLFWRGLSGPLIERAGYWILAGLWMSFACLLLAFGWRGAQFALLFAAFAVGAVWRIVQIRRELRGIVAAAKEIGARE